MARTHTVDGTASCTARCTASCTARLRGARRATLRRAVRAAAGREVGRRCRSGAAPARRGWRWVPRPWRTPRASSTAAAALGYQRLTARARLPRSRPARGATLPGGPPRRAPRRQPRARPLPRVSPDRSSQAIAGSGVAWRGGARCPAAAVRGSGSPGASLTTRGRCPCCRGPVERTAAPTHPARTGLSGRGAARASRARGGGAGRRMMCRRWPCVLVATARREAGTGCGRAAAA